VEIGALVPSGYDQRRSDGAAIQDFVATVANLLLTLMFQS
jgi:hypothetical protein